VAGDPLQLPPTIKNEKIKDKLSVTLFERVNKIWGDKVVKMLTIQYRMNELISNWSSSQLYNNQLVPADEVLFSILSLLLFFLFLLFLKNSTNY